MNKFEYQTGLLLTIILLAGCSFYEDTVTSPENLLPVAWDYFEKGNYQAAYTKFDAALDADPKNMDAYHGRAWSALLLNNPQQAIGDFNSAIYYGESGLDPVAGLAFAYHADQSYSAAISKAQSVLTANSYYYFEYKPVINYRDLQLILAMSHLHIGNLDFAYQYIRLLDPDVSVSPDNPASWCYSDQQYASYAETLVAILDYLDVFYGM